LIVTLLHRQPVENCCWKTKTKKIMMENLKIGIIGGGKFGKKIIPQAVYSGFDVLLMDKEVDAVWASQKSFFLKGDPTEFDDLIKFGEQLDILTVHAESVNIPALELLQSKGVKIFPAPGTVEILQDKYFQKEFLKEKNIPTVTRWCVAGNSTPQLTSAGTFQQNDSEILTRPKQDQMVVDTLEYLPNNDGVYLSQANTISVKRELQVLVSRNENGVIECYDPALLILDNGKMFVDFDICPSDLNREMAANACMLAGRVAESLRLRGVIAVELVLAGNGRMYVNDLTLRPYECLTNLQNCQADSKVSLLTRLLLNLPEKAMDPTDIWSKLAIVEPAAYRKHTIEEALKTILCMGEVVHNQNDEIIRYRKNRTIVNSEQAIDERLSKAIVIRHLLHGG
jgi:5-(carboxyamino)imidazole ribonucleotide synthase